MKKYIKAMLTSTGSTFVLWDDGQLGKEETF